MHVHRSNRTEALVDVLGAVVARPVGGPAEPECIVVQGKGMERWLSMRLAQRFGVWANPRFPFPRKLIEDAIAAVLGPEGAPSACFEPEILMWAITALLPLHAGRPEFAPIRTYLTNDERGIKRIALAQRIADTFDQYVVYRPQMVIEWERGAGTDWQAVLWRALVARHGSTHIAARAAAFLRVAPTTAPNGFPRRVCVFGISTLPPLYVQLLAALSAQVEIHLFLLSPSREYWADIQSQREAIRAQARSGTSADTLHFVEGHPLLASLGRLGRDFQQVLEATGDYQETEADLYLDPGTGGMLATLQSDILRLVHRGRGDNQAALPLRRNDDSISVHACHSPMREVEALHDQLLAAFDADDTLEPRDVVVMSPAIDAYAPLIEAVFGGAPDPRVPYRIADRGVRATEEVADAFATLLTVLRGRMTATDVLDLLGMEAIRARFGIVGEDLDVLRTWITESGIRWGVDDADRAAADQPRRRENTWRFGLDRLLLGHAMGGDNRDLFHEVLPYEDIEGTAAELLGRLTDFCEALFTLRAELEGPHPLTSWRDALSSALERMVATTRQTADQHQRIRGALADLAARAERAGFGEAIDIDALRAQLELAMQRSASAHGFLAGGVTFCALVPMRTIPFRIVCLLGMNDDLFPRTQRPFGFDLMAQHPRPGDRSPREDDRYLFLEALSSARQRLIITYVGQSIRDNTEIPPSVVVSELLDALDDSFRIPGSGDTPRPSVATGAAEPGETLPLPFSPRAQGARHAASQPVREHVVVRHPLQPFSPRYFQPDSRLFSYASSYCDGAQTLVQPRRTPAPFLATPLPPPGEGAQTVELDNLVRFFEHPSRAFLQRRLQLYLGGDTPIVEDREPMEVDQLGAWEIGHDLLERCVRGEDLGTAFAAVRASGVLPVGVPGECVYADLRPPVELIGRRARELMTGGHCAPVEVHVQCGDFRITGVLHDLWPAGLIRHQFSRLGGRHELGVWIRHLVLNLLAPSTCKRTSYIVGRAANDDPAVVVRFGPVSDPAATLRELLHLYWIGQTYPLPLFPRTSRLYVEELLSGRPGDREALAIAAARRAYAAKPHTPVPADEEDVYVQQLFCGSDPFAATAGRSPASSFTAVARAVFAPLLAHREVIE